MHKSIFNVNIVVEFRKNHFDLKQLNKDDLMGKIVQSFPKENFKFEYEYYPSVEFPYGINIYFEQILEILRKEHNLLCTLLSLCKSNENKKLFAKFFLII